MKGANLISLFLLCLIITARYKNTNKKNARWVKPNERDVVV
jgi:hypothetical protein